MITGRQLFKDFDPKKLHLKWKELLALTNDDHNARYAAKVFASCVELVVNDIIENSVEFQLPGTSIKQGQRQTTYLHMNRTTGLNFKKAYQHNKWNDVDIFASNMTGYQLSLHQSRYSYAPYEIPVYVGHDMKDRITELTNKGKQW